jgi:hydrogenase 3 maturation protease
MLESLIGKLKGKVMLLGVGNSLRGDDGAGPYLVEQLRDKVDAALLNCEEVPENFLGKVTQAHPDTILIIDAVDLGAKPGAVAILEGDELKGTGWSTHHAPLQLFIDCIKAETRADVFVLAIQPKSTHFGSKISDEVKQSLGFLQQIIPRALALKQSHSY